MKKDDPAIMVNDEFSEYLTWLMHCAYIILQLCVRTKPQAASRLFAELSYFNAPDSSDTSRVSCW